MLSGFFFASTRPVQIATNCLRHRMCFTGFASTRPVQIATSICVFVRLMYILCLHTPRADCNLEATKDAQGDFAPLPPHAPCRLQLAGGASLITSSLPLPPHAPCRLQRKSRHTATFSANFASTRPVQIATFPTPLAALGRTLCLHTPRADCNPCHTVGGSTRVGLCLHTPRADCNLAMDTIS